MKALNKITSLSAAALAMLFTSAQGSAQSSLSYLLNAV
jgi:hypothetical protein